jgi:alkaline phosphatase D
MNKRLSLLVISCFLISNNAYAYKYALGSCLDQDLEQPIWNAIERQDIDGFIFLGDNVYGDQKSGELVKLKRAYKTQKNKIPPWLFQKKILTIWDDHDYGKNDGGGSYKNKREAQKLFLDFWEIPKHDLRQSREGIFFEETQQIEGKKIQFIGLDTRYFRTGLKRKKNGYIANDDLNASILGTQQWEWLNSTTISIAEFPGWRHSNHHLVYTHFFSLLILF